MNAREAKEFLISRIVPEAQRRRVSLSEVERQMLYFSETNETLPHLKQVAEEFERDYGASAYEKKVAGLIASLQRRLRNGSEAEWQAWSEAIQTIRHEDHYLLVLLRQAKPSARPPGDLLRLWGTGLALCLGLLLMMVLLSAFGIHLTGELARFLLWAAAACLAGEYLIFYVIVGKARAIDLTDRFIDRVLGFLNPSK
jgi:hypothetical protein